MSLLQMFEGVTERQIRDLVDHWKVGLVRLDQNYVITFVNNEFLQIDGRPREELLGKTFVEAWPGESHQKAVEITIKAMTEGQWGTTHSLRFDRTDGKHRWVDFRAVPMGEGIGCFTIDITAPELLKMEVTELERRYMLAARVTTDIIYDWDLERNILRLSENGAKMLGVKSENSPGAMWWIDRLHPDDREGAVKILKNALLSGAFQWSDEYRMKIGDRYALIYERGYIIHDDEGRPSRAMGALSDISEMRAAQEQVIALENELIHVSRLSAMGTMASVMSHELNQPLAAVGSFLAGTERLLASSEEPNLNMVINGVRKAREAATRASDIMRRMRRMTRKKQPIREQVSLLKAANDAANLVLSGRPLNKGQLHIDIPENLTVYCDQIQIEQVLLNLIRNAFEANEEVGGEEVIVRAREYGPNQVEIIVEDRGPGIEEDQKEHLFDFFISTKPDGMGIGLPISRSIIEAHGGRLQVQNREDGGAQFMIIMSAREIKD